MRSSPPPIPRQRRRLFHPAAIVLLFLVLLATVGVGYHWWLAARIQHRLAAVRAAHEPVSLAELNAYYPTVPASSNAATAYARAFAIVQESRSARFLQRLEQLPSGSGQLPAETQQSMQSACDQNAGAFEALEQAARLKLCRFPVDYRPGWNALLPHLRLLQQCAALELCRGVLAEQKGDLDSALECTSRILQLSAALNSEPDLISVLIQRRIEFAASELLRWLLNHRQLSDPQITKLHEMFKSAERKNQVERALISDRCFVVATFDSSSGQILDTIDPGYSPRFGAILGLQVLRVSGRFKRDEMRYLEDVSECQKAILLSLPSALDRLEQISQTAKQEAVPKKFIITGMFLPPLVKGLRQNAVGAVRLSLLQTALALEQYRLSDGRLPDSLASLCPRFLSTVPTDPFGKKEILYRREPQGYVVYSVGPDRHDNGGIQQLPLEAKIDYQDRDIIFSVAR